MSGYWYFVFGFWYFASGIWLLDRGVGTLNKTKHGARRPKSVGASNYSRKAKMTNKKQSILIVDDEPDMCWALASILVRMDFYAQKAFNGEQALRLVAENQFPMAFLDAKLPDIEGLDLAGQIRQKDAGVRIFIVSGYFYKNDKEVRQAVSQGLIAGFIAKPFDHEEIRTAIRNCFSR